MGSCLVQVRRVLTWAPCVHPKPGFGAGALPAAFPPSVSVPRPRRQPPPRARPRPWPALRVEELAAALGRATALRSLSLSGAGAPIMTGDVGSLLAGGAGRGGQRGFVAGDARGG